MEYTPENFDIRAFLTHLDELFDQKRGGEVEPFLLDALAATRSRNDRGSELTVLNELMGFYRSQSLYAKALDSTQQALTLVDSLGLGGSEASTTTLINAATAYRAAGETEKSLELYKKAIEESERTLSPHDRRLAALHNNLSIAYSEQEDFTRAHAELTKALEILTASSPDPSTDIDIGSTHANLALVCYRENLPEQAQKHIDTALRIFASGHHEDASHFSSALAAAGEAFFRMGRLSESIDVYHRSLDLIERSYGRDNDYYTITQANLAVVENAQKTAGKTPLMQKNDVSDDTAPQAFEATDTGETAVFSAQPQINGLELARRFWKECGAPLIEQKYERVRGRIAAGLVGHGSEVYGFDDEASRDHDFAPRFCLWLTPEDYADFGENLQHDYDALPAQFMGFSRTDIERTPRSQGAQKRDGVFEIPRFYESLTGYEAAPTSADSDAGAWLLLDEATLAAATNGEVFADPLGKFSSQRRLFKAMPDDVRLSLISRRLGMMAQAGQYNFARMSSRGQSAGAWRAINEFVHASASLVFLINGPSAVGYLPYYKWEMAALKRLSTRMGMKLTQVASLLDSLMKIASCASYPSEDTGESSSAHDAAYTQANALIENICALVRDELLAEGLTRSTESFLEWQRPYVEEHITNPQLRSL